MDKRTNQNNMGFTLIELIVSLAISAFVILAAYSLVMVGTKNYDSTHKTTSLQQEVTFTNNLLGESIRAATVADTSITYSNYNGTKKDVEIHTGNKVIYYDESEESLFIYEEQAGLAIGASEYKANKEDNLVSKYVTDFNAEFLPTESGATLTTITAPGGTASAESNLIKITMTVTVKNNKYEKGKTDTSEVIYQIRNNS